MKEIIHNFTYFFMICLHTKQFPMVISYLQQILLR